MAEHLGLLTVDLPEPDAVYWDSRISLRESYERIISWALGIAFGRWDIRTKDADPTEQVDLLAAQPLSPPALMTEFPGRGYPLEPASDGLLSFDVDRPGDIVSRVEVILEVVFGSDAERLERDMAQTLGVQDVRDYFQKPGIGGFWSDHVSRYSSFRRKSPIYWLLQSSKKSYALWIYYHRLDKDILFKALLNHVEPKDPQGRVPPR